MRRFLVFLSLVFVASSSAAQSISDIELRRGKSAYQPKGYYVSEVVDDRQQQGAIGNMNGDKLDLKGGVAEGIKSYIDQNTIHKSNLAPIELHVTELVGNATRERGLWKVTLQMGVTFYANGKKLLELTGKGNASSVPDPRAYLGSLIVRTLNGDLEKFDQWWGANKSHVPLQSKVNLEVTMADKPDKPGFLVYNLARPLQISDFKGPVEGSPQEAAVTVSGIGLRSQGSTENSQFVIRCTISPNFNVQRSWFKRSNVYQEERVLAHEQTHFDITALYACKLLKTLLTTQLTDENYSTVISRLQEENSKEAITEEDLYDNETNHGTIAARQAEWEKKISTAVRQCGCF
jgi:hypothetical protein